MKPKILIIEDNQETKELLKFTADLADCEAVTADDGVEGLEKVKTEKPDLIILDLRMPRMNGDQVLAQLLKDEATKNIPVLVSSGEPAGADIDKIGKMANVRGFLSKPYDTDVVLGIIKEILPRG